MRLSRHIPFGAKGIFRDSTKPFLYRSDLLIICPRREVSWFDKHKQGAPDTVGLPSPPGTLRSDLDPSAPKRYAEAFVFPRLREGRMTLIACLAMVVAIAEAGALITMLPLKERIPYFARIDDTGTLVPDERVVAVKAENVKQAQVSYFLKLWTRNLLTIDAQLRSNLPRTAIWVQGAGANELTEWLEKIDRPAERLGREPTLTREVAKVVMTYGQGKTAFAHIELVERNAGNEVRRLKKLMQVDYDLTDQLSDDNPIGLVILHFTVADE